MYNPIQYFLQVKLSQMHTSKNSIMSSVLISMFSFLFIVSEAAPIYSSHYCTDSNTFRPNSTFQANLNLLLSTLSSEASKGSSFNRTSTGRDTPDIVTGLFLCRGDILTPACHECVTAAAEDIKSRCPVEKEVIIWYDECMLRYSNQSLNNIVPAVDLADDKNLSRKELKRFNELLASTLNALAKKAANSECKKFATAEVNFTNAETLYGLVECTPELTFFECNTCFQSAIAFVPTCCDGKTGARVLLPGCNIRYEFYPFYNVTATLTPPVGQTLSSGRSHVSFVLSFVIPIVASVFLFVLGLYSFVGKQARSMVLSWKKTNLSAL